jgi:RNA polymerase primary sigma factor
MGEAQVITPSQNTSAYITQIARHRILTQEEEAELIRRAKAGNLPAEKALVRHNLRFVFNVAFRFRNRGLELDELVTEGATGLQMAIRRFKLESGYRLTSYAVWWIRAQITKALEQQARLIRFPGNLEKPLRKHRGKPLEQCIGGELHPKDPEPLARAAAAALAPFSIDAPLSEEGEGYAAFLASPDPSPEDWTATQSNADYLRRLLHHLEPKERRILSLSYGLESGEPLDLAVIGRQFGLSRERVRQIKLMAIRRLQKVGQSGKI